MNFHRFHNSSMGQKLSVWLILVMRAMLLVRWEMIVLKIVGLLLLNSMQGGFFNSLIGIKGNHPVKIAYLFKRLHGIKKSKPRTYSLII
ncbi:hypothetical protein AAY42_16490 [Flagellimonas eckloniae]|uniref:Uncharacterized protein n=1 Tax=Flagellimonas eckloniae TaxID=346185 RepID=A0A0Q0XK92_9FLAO|nr:hypothetical protein AAY42_16490 [Allomuricauda eckloniae]